MEKKKILFVNHAFILAGAPKSLSYLLKSIDRSVYDPVLLCIKEGPANALFREIDVPLIIEPHIKVFHGSTVAPSNIQLVIRNWLFLVPSIIYARRILRQIQPDLIHLNSTCLFAFAIGAKWWNSRVPVICHVREPIRRGWLGWPLRYFCKKFVNGFIAISKFDMDSISIPTSDTKTKCELIYNFVDHNDSSRNISPKEFRRSLGIKSSDIVFLYLARFAQGNGWRELISLAEKIVVDKLDFHFVLVGAESHQISYPLASGNIHLLQFQKNVDHILNESDVFVCPFTEPHFARGVIEASAKGLPILAANVGGVNELVIHGKTGFLYDGFESFVKYSNLLGENIELRKSMGQEGIAFAKERFDFFKNSKKTFDFYNSFFS